MYVWVRDNNQQCSGSVPKLATGGPCNSGDLPAHTDAHKRSAQSTEPSTSPVHKIIFWELGKLGIKPGGAQGSLLVLCSGTTPGAVPGIKCNECLGPNWDQPHTSQVSA